MSKSSFTLTKLAQKVFAKTYESNETTYRLITRSQAIGETHKTSYEVETKYNADDVLSGYDFVRCGNLLIPTRNSVLELLSKTKTVNGNEITAEDMKFLEYVMNEGLSMAADKINKGVHKFVDNPTVVFNRENLIDCLANNKEIPKLNLQFDIKTLPDSDKTYTFVVRNDVFIDLEQYFMKVLDVHARTLTATCNVNGHIYCCEYNSSDIVIKKDKWYVRFDVQNAYNSCSIKSLCDYLGLKYDHPTLVNHPILSKVLPINTKLSDLFSMVMNKIIHKAMSIYHNVSLCYAYVDDGLAEVDSQEVAEMFLDYVRKELDTLGMKLNLKKTLITSDIKEIKFYGKQYHE